MTAILAGTESTAHFSDYKSTTDRRTKAQVPDVAVMNHNGLLRIVGELKTPWISQHDLAAGYRKLPHLRRILGM